MASEERNALAGLAERLDPRNYHRNDFLVAVESAKRIIAELAKVPVSSDVIHKGDLEISIVHSYQSKCLSKCRTIAEEGANNG